MDLSDKIKIISFSSITYLIYIKVLIYYNFSSTKRKGRKMNIPIYRAKKIDSDEYVEGDFFYEKYIIAKSKLNTLIADAINHIEYDILKNECIDENCKIEHTQLKDMLNKLILNERFEHIYEIAPTTLAIHFPDMLDSQGNKIFASLSEYGKGGDIIHRDGMTFETIYKSVNGRFEAYEINGMHHLLVHKFHQTKIIGIQ